MRKPPGSQPRLGSHSSSALHTGKAYYVGGAVRAITSTGFIRNNFFQRRLVPRRLIHQHRHLYWGIGGAYHEGKFTGFIGCIYAGVGDKRHTG